MPRGWGPCSWLLPRTSALQHSLLERGCLVGRACPLQHEAFPTPSQPHDGCRRWESLALPCPVLSSWVRAGVGPVPHRDSQQPGLDFPCGLFPVILYRSYPNSKKVTPSFFHSPKPANRGRAEGWGRHWRPSGRT